jgi:A/G-specific adenine glycosylase
VYRHYRIHGRDLPWRRTRDPYHILVSEIMLQQTQVDRVAAAYERFIARFPDVRTLSRARLSSVLMVWQGLGYNRRARYLHLAARDIVALHNGRVPSDPNALAALAGIGKATAASIAAFAFDRPTVFVETNIRSVLIHHFFDGRADIADSEIVPLVERTLDRRHPRQWYSALMDYGTHLKATHPNPSRRSRHHVRQTRFEGSTRQLRGRALRLLLARPCLTMTQIAARLKDSRTRDIVEKLCAEGMLSRSAGRLHVARHESLTSRLPRPRPR